VVATAGASSIQIPASRFKDDDFVAACTSAPDSLIYFLCNVGDGDTQLILLPAENGVRHAIVVDVATTKKLPRLIAVLEGENVLHHEASRYPIVVATHPHDDHIGGMPEFIDAYREKIGEFWEPGFYHPSARYVETMRALEKPRDNGSQVDVLQPTSGTSRFVSKIRLTALSPGMVLRSRFDTFGTEINDASIALKLEFPAARVTQDGENRHYLRLREPWALVLGADAQTTSWAQAILDFPQLYALEGSALSRELNAALGRDALRGQVFKVPHHASKHGLNIELVERISPQYCLISSTGGNGRYGFPHELAVEAIREARQPTTVNRADRKTDYELGIHYTAAFDDTGVHRPLGSIALIVPPNPRSRLQLWRLGDKADEPIGLDRARRFER
jgi:beta-lactamase superfamily II metal-dependent hydrolase